MNNCNLIGRLTSDPEVRYTATTNTMIVQFTIAVNRPYAKPDDEQKADFITILAWSKTGEFASKYFRKGQQVGVTGRIETGYYDDKDGKRVYTTKVIADHLYFADSRKEDSNVSNQTPFGEVQSPVTDDDLPF